MKTISLVLNFHIPLKFKNYPFYKIGNDHSYYNELEQRNEVEEFCDKQYNLIINDVESICKSNTSDFNIAIYISGTTIELLIKYRPETLEALQRLSKYSCCEILGGTYSNSLSSIFDIRKFETQIIRHRDLMKNIFQQKPQVFLNCHLLYNDDVASSISSIGFNSAIIDLSMADSEIKSLNSVYGSSASRNLSLLSCNKDLSRRLNPSHRGNVKQFLTYIDSPAQKGSVITLMVNSNIIDLNFFEFFINTVIVIPQLELLTPSETVKEYSKIGYLSVKRETMKNIYFKNYGKIASLMIDAYSKSFCDFECGNNNLKDLDAIHSCDHLCNCSEENYLNEYINYMNILKDFSEVKELPN